MNWPAWIAIPILAFYTIPFWLRATIAVIAVVLIGAELGALVR